MVCAYDWEIRHPQELIHPIKDMQKLPWTRPRGTETFISTGFINEDGSVLGVYCTPVSQQGLADYGTADCARANYDIGYRSDGFAPNVDFLDISFTLGSSTIG